MRDPAYQQVMDDLDVAARNLIATIVAADRKEKRGKFKGTKKRQRLAARMRRYRSKFFRCWHLLPENQAWRGRVYAYLERVAKEMSATPKETLTRALFHEEMP